MSWTVLFENGIVLSFTTSLGRVWSRSRSGRFENHCTLKTTQEQSSLRFYQSRNIYILMPRSQMLIPQKQRIFFSTMDLRKEFRTEIFLISLNLKWIQNVWKRFKAKLIHRKFRDPGAVTPPPTEPGFHQSRVCGGDVVLMIFRHDHFYIDWFTLTLD